MKQSRNLGSHAVLSTVSYEQRVAGMSTSLPYPALVFVSLPRPGLTLHDFTE